MEQKDKKLLLDPDDVEQLHLNYRSRNNCRATGQPIWSIQDSNHPLFESTLGGRVSTGVLIDDDHFLTAGHTFDPNHHGINEAIGLVFTPQEISKLMRVSFNYHGNESREESYAIEELVEYKLNGLDYAIVRLAGSPGKKHGVVTIRLPDQAQFYTYTFHHPLGSPKIYCQSKSPSLPIGNEILYQMQMTTGSSGAGIFDCHTNHLIAVHTSRFGKSSLHIGLRTTDIYDASPTLRKAVQSDPTLVSSSELQNFGVFAHQSVLQQKAIDEEYRQLARMGGRQSLPKNLPPPNDPHSKKAFFLKNHIDNSFRKYDDTDDYCCLKRI